MSKFGYKAKVLDVYFWVFQEEELGDVIRQ